jgi:ribosomal-protein-serine acetyltransferase
LSSTLLEAAYFSEASISIRPYREEDIPTVFEAVRGSIPELSRWLPWCHPNYTEQDCAAFVLSCEGAWTKREEFSFAIVESATGRFLGGAGLNLINYAHGFANVGYWVRSSCTRRGVATAALRTTARFGFTELNLNHIQILAATGNAASQRVAEKAGARRECVLRKRLVHQENVLDAVLFSLIPEDLEK